MVSSAENRLTPTSRGTRSNGHAARCSTLRAPAGSPRTTPSAATQTRSGGFRPCTSIPMGWCANRDGPREPSTAELVDHDAVVPYDLRRQQITLLVGDVVEESRAQPLEPQRQLEIAVVLGPRAKRLQLGALPRVLLAKALGPKRPQREVVVQERKD